MNITFISASAGSGKTYRVTEEVERELVAGTTRPAGLVVTTFTVKAAQELRERLSRRLYDQGHNIIAERLEEALIGTVHGVCRQLLERFAFEAGISPRLEIMDEEQARLLLAQAVENVTDAATLDRLQAVATRLGQVDRQHRTFKWKGQLRQILEVAQSNDVAPDQLLMMAESSVNELLAFFPEPTDEDLDQELLRAIQTAIKNIGNNGDATKTTDAYLQLLRDSERDLTQGRLPWSKWVKLSIEWPAKASKPDAEAVVAVAAQFEKHPHLRDHIQAYTTILFQLAQRALAEFRRLKEERGLLDFSDLEQRTLHLLREDASVKAVLGQELDLLVVDEFQDTSPIQLAIFMELAACAHRVVWVGDVKQAIYGFRGSDPELMNAVVNEVAKGVGLAEPLKNSYRSTPELVRVTNTLFAPAFASSLGLPKEQVRLEAKRKSIEPVQPAVEFLELSSGIINKSNAKTKRLTNAKFSAALAERVRQWLESTASLRVQDPHTKQSRPLELRDIAILCRKNDDAADLAESLSNRGMPVSLIQSGLLSTPEARLGLACLRRLVDPRDTLATAEIIALQASQSPEQWLEQRLTYLESLEAVGGTVRSDRWGWEEPAMNPAIVALEQARPRLICLSPVEALDLALEAGGVYATVTTWGPSTTRVAQRRANLEALRTLVHRYQEACVVNHLPATIAGFLYWSDERAQAGEDNKGFDERLNAIHVSTYHKAKGLEWPVVICTGFDTEPRPRFWDPLAAVQDSKRSFDLKQPLANRRIRFWAWPFGEQQKGIEMLDRLMASATGQEVSRLARQEELRLLYVGMTRARDLLVIAQDPARACPWLEMLEAPWFQSGEDGLVLPDGDIIAVSRATVVPPDEISGPIPESSYPWFRPAEQHTARLPSRLVPSGQPPLSTASTGQMIELGARLTISGKPVEAELGDALHAILAAEFIHPAHPNRKETAARVIHSYGLEPFLNPDEVIEVIDRFQAHLESVFKPRRYLVETPFEMVNAMGQRLSGFIDLVLETSDGWVVVDHKSFPGPRVDWAAKALAYNGQLSIYRQALIQDGMKVAGCWIHFVVGGMVEVCF